MVSPSIEDLEHWWDISSSFAMRVLFVRTVYQGKFVDTINGLKSAEALANADFRDLDRDIQILLYSFQNPF